MIEKKITEDKAKMNALLLEQKIAKNLQFQ